MIKHYFIHLKVLLSISLFFIHFVAQSQINFADNLNEWYTIKSTLSSSQANPNSIDTSTTIFKTVSDTLIEGKNWVSIFSFNDTSIKSNSIAEGFVCYDNNRVLYFKNNNSDIDTLYNFNLNVGDSFLFKFKEGEKLIQVKKIDSIQINGVFHKKYYFNKVIWPLCCQLEEVWIEGIGSIHGPLFSLNPRYLEIETYEETNNVSCFYQKDVIVWNDSNISKCYITSSTNVAFHTNVNMQKVNLYPNPTNGIFRIEISASKLRNHKLEVINLYGHLLDSKQILDGSYELNLEPFPKGQYLIKVYSDKNNLISTHKAIKL